MAERQQAHRQHLERTVIHGDATRANIGLATAFVVALAFLAVSGFLINNGHDLAGGALGSIDIVPLVGAFIYGAKTRSDERQRREAMLLNENGAE